MAVLYRKYRPQTFSDVLNQRHIIQTLKNQVQTGQISHAYLFTGTRGVGKTSVARILAKALNCGKSAAGPAGSDWDGNPCGECDNCRQISQGSFLDLVEIDAASNTGVDNIRELIEHIRFSPSTGKYKVFIIDEVHMLSKGAFNALLKTLEEPPDHAVFVLATTEANKVPATIISRTQRFDFKRLSVEDLRNHLEKIIKEEGIALPAGALELVVRNAEGSVRDSLSLLDKILTLGREATLEECEQLLGVTDIAACESLLGLIAGGEAEKIPAFFAGLLERGVDFAVFNRDFLEYLRKALVYKTAGKQVLEGGHARELEELAEKLTLAELIFIIRLFLKSYKDLAVSPDPEIPLLVSGLEAAARRSGSSTNGSGNKTPSQKVAATEKQAVKEEAEMAADAPALLKQEDGPALVALTQAEEIISVEELKGRWDEFIEKVKEVNGPLASLVRNHPIGRVFGNNIFLEVKYVFHKQNLENPKNQKVLCQKLSEVFGKNLRISGEVAKDDGAGKPAATEVLADALKIFGGELVE